MSLSAGEVEMILTARDEMTPVIHEAKEHLKDFHETTHEAGHETSLFGEIVEEVFGSWPAKIAEGILLRDAVHELIDVVKEGAVEFGIIGSEVNDVKEGFERLSKGTEEAEMNLDAMRKGVVGTIGDFELMKQANKLLAVGAIENSEQFKVLTEASRVLSHEGFGPIPNLLGSISNAMETGRTRRLALMGITINTAAAEKEYAASLGLTVPELSKSQKLHADRQALLEALTHTIESAGEQETNLAERIEASGVALENWTHELASAIAASPAVNAAFEAISDAVKEAFGSDSQSLIEHIVEWVNFFADAVRQYGPPIIATLGEIKDWIVQIWHTAESAWDVVPDWFKNIARDSAAAGGAALLASEAIKMVGGQENASTLENVISLWSSMADPIKAVLSNIELLSIAIRLEGWAGFKEIIAGWGASIYAATIGPLAGFINSLYAAAIAAEGVGSALAASMILLTAWVAAIAGAIAIVTALYEAVMLGVEAFQRHAAESRQDAVDSENLARINKATGKEFTNLGDAVKYVTDHATELRNGFKPLKESLDLLREAGGNTIQPLNELNKTVIGLANAGELPTKVMKEVAAAIKASGVEAKALPEALRNIVEAMGRAAEASEDAGKRSSKYAEATAAGLAKAEQLWDEYFTLSDKMAGDSLGVQLSTIDRWVDHELTALNKTKKYNEDYWNEVAAIEELARLKREDAERNHERALSAIREHADAERIDAAYAASVEAAAQQKSVDDKAVADYLASQKALYAETEKLTKSSFDLQIEQIRRHLEEQNLALDHSSQYWEATWNNNTDVANQQIDEIEWKKLQAGIDTTIETAKLLSDTVSGSFTNALTKIPQLLQDAFTGGGNLMGAVKAIGVQLSEALIKPLMYDLTQAQQKIVGLVSGIGAAGTTGLGAVAGLSGTTNSIIGLGTALTGTVLATHAATLGMAGFAAGSTGATVAAGAFTLGIGAAAVGLAVLIKHWVGVSQGEKDARKEFEDYQKQFGTLDQMIDTVGKAYALTGRTGTEAQHDLSVALDATHHSAAEVHAALEVINQVMEEARTKALAIKAVDDAFQALLGTVNDVGIGIPAALQPMVDQMLAMPGITDDVKKALQGLSDNAKPNFAQLESLAKNYGISLSDLGPAFQQAHVTDEATKIINDFQKLTGAGADANAVIRGMGDEISAVVQHSIQFGTTIPENMRPMIEALIASGLLFDENKEAITDISKLKFGEAVKTDVDRLAEAIKALADAIGLIPEKIGKIPNDVTVRVHGEYIPPDIPYEDVSAAASGGLVTASGVVSYLQTGGEIAFMPRGTDTVPAMLSPGERVLTTSENAIWESGRFGGSNSNVHDDEVHQEVRRLSERLTRLIEDQPRALARALADSMTLTRRIG